MEWIVEHLNLTCKEILLYLALFVVTFVGSLAMVTWILVTLPATYFSDVHPHPPMWGERDPILRWLGRIVKNLLGLVLVVAGIVMALPGIPGQGLLTFLIGVMLVDFPGKRRLEQKLVRRPKVLSFINKLRARYKKEPLVVDPD